MSLLTELTFGNSKMAIPLEDNVGDIIGKAQRGLQISDSELAKRAGLRGEQMGKLRGGTFDETTLRAIAPVLDLDADALVDLAQEKWQPDEVENFDGLAQFTSDYSRSEEHKSELQSR